MKMSKIKTWTNQDFEELELLSLQNFKQLRANLINYFDQVTPEKWLDIAKSMNEVLESCDEIDYDRLELAEAYAIWHLLDRYHRFQIMQLKLLQMNRLNHWKSLPIRILDVGTGPAPALFAFSDHYRNLNKLSMSELYKMESDYVEQSKGFRQFIHTLCELSLDNHSYSVPFHFGTFTNFKSIVFDNEYYDYWHNKITKQTHRFNIAVFSNFLTTKETVERFTFEIEELTRAMRNYGLIIIVGASNEKSEKYSELYLECDKIIVKKFNNRKFHGYWRKLVQETITYNYDDEYGEIMRQFYLHIKSKFLENNAWNLVPNKAQKYLEKRIDNNTDKIKFDNWKGVTWVMSVYQKRSWSSSFHKL